MILRIVFLVIVTLHTLIHLMGFVKAFQWVDIPQLTQPIAKPAGMLWLLATVLFLAGTMCYLFKMDSWWMVMLAAVLLSQVLIIGSWQDAKFGTIANVIILVGSIIGYGTWSFNKTANREVASLQNAADTSTEQTVTKESIAHLPPVIQKWMDQSGVTGKKFVRTVYLQQQGQMRTKPDGSWMPFTAQQYFTTRPPGFCWIADVQAAPGIRLKGLDRFKEGKGHMLIELLGLVPVVNAKGEEIDQGTMVRYLAEIVWFPSAALTDAITWEQLNDSSAKATMTYQGTTASATFHFASNGLVQSIDAERYYNRQNGSTLEQWHIDNDLASYQEIDGYKVPTKSTVTWRLAEGDFQWLTLNIKDVQYHYD